MHEINFHWSEILKIMIFAQHNQKNPLVFLKCLAIDQFLEDSWNYNFSGHLDDYNFLLSH